MITPDFLVLLARIGDQSIDWWGQERLETGGIEGRPGVATHDLAQSYAVSCQCTVNGEKISPAA
jgi:hypothetical protein